jgi:hypothetical protein
MTNFDCSATEWSNHRAVTIPYRLHNLLSILRRDSIAPGLIGIVTSPFLAYFLWQSAVNERALIEHAQVVPATLVTVRSAKPDPRDGDGGAEGEYSYEMLDGTTGQIRRGYDTLDDIPGNGNDKILEVEYLPGKPDVKRVKGTGSITINEWRFWLIIKSGLLIAFTSGVIWMLVRGLKNE